MNTHALSIIALLCFIVGVDCWAQDVAPPKEQKPTASFEGRWVTKHGDMELYANGKFMEGTYPGGELRGAVTGNTFAFFYEDQFENGQAKFELSEDGNQFSGRYKASGSDEWVDWYGTRATPRGFHGLWDTPFGKLRLNVVGSEVSGAYNYEGTDATVKGQVKDGRLEFRYREPALVASGRPAQEGSAWFEISPDEESISGMYRPDGETQWEPWEGKRDEAPMGGKWLVILEANWEKTLEGKQFSFADMLEEYFTMDIASHVKVRTRSFHDSTDLIRFCREIKYLPGPVVLLFSTHGTKDGLQVFNETISPKVLADGLAGTNNLELIHLSGCSMMEGEFPDKLQKLMGSSACSISGYKAVVPWDASAIADFTFLSRLLIRRMKPGVAVKQTIELSPFIGSKRVEGTVYGALGLSIKEVK